MADDNNKPPQRPAPGSDLLAAMMAIALAVVAQLAVRDGLTLLGVAGYIAAAWLFLSSVRGIFDSARSRQTSAEPETADVAPLPSADGPGWLSYLRRNWRLVTIAEIFRGDIPPARLQAAEVGIVPQARPGDAPTEDDPETAGGATAPVAGAAHVESWAASESAQSTPKSVKVTPQGDILVLDTGLEQVQRFDDAGKLLATYSLQGLAGLEVLDLAVSSDGQKLYIVDAASNRLQVITLTTDDPSGEEE
jgi:hypothetical protein